MRLLLDTHAFRIAHPDNRVLVSTATVWEIAVKRSLGKLQAPADIAAGIRQSDFEVLPITLAHAQAVEHLPWHHRDPFDRMLLAQAHVEQATLVSMDAALRAYGVPLLG